MAVKNKVAVTGDLGFIGGHLKKALHESGYEVVCFDLARDKSEDIRFLEPKDFADVEYVFHLAAKAKVQQSIDDPLMTHSHNIDGTLNVLWCAYKAGVKRVIFSSSSSVYGDQLTLPLEETMKPNPLSPYALHKLVGENYCKMFGMVYGLETVCLRYFNVFGENMPLFGAYTAAIRNFFEQKKQGTSLTVFGGAQTRDFTYVGDVVRANILAAETPIKMHGEVFNIGSGKNHSIKEIAETISDDVTFLPQRTGEPMDTLADNDKAKYMLGWSPTVDVLEWLETSKELF